MRDGLDAAVLPLQAAKVPSSAALAAATTLAVLFAAYALSLALAVLPGNVDVSWLIVVCERLLDGERLTVDVMEVNPPFSVWLYMPYVLLERLVGGHAETWMAVGVVAAGLASVAVSCRMLARADDIYRTPQAMMALPVMVFLALCLFPGEFGQREQMAVIAVLPWLALQCVRQRDPAFAAPGRWQTMLAGICAGIVVMIKPPHFALALILPSACLAVHRRSWKPLFVPENLLGAALVTAYAASISLFQPSFLTEVLPFVGDLYLPLRESFLYLLKDWPQTVLLLAMLVPIIAGGLSRVHWDAAIPLLSAYLDAPVSGGTVGAEAGTLAIMAGGERAAFERAEPVFAAMGRATHVGPAGSGQLAKLANQAIVGITIGAVAEALLLAAAGGADPVAVRAAIRGGFAESRILEVHGQRMLDRDFAPRGHSRTQLKDLNTIVETARELELDLPLSSNVRDRFERMVRDLPWGDTDHAALLLELEEANAPHRVGQAPDKLS